MFNNIEIIMEDKVIEVVDQVALAQSVSDHIKYEMKKDLLVKPLAPITVNREVTVPKVKETTNDKELELTDIQEYDEVETKVIEVESMFREGIVLKVPAGYKDSYTVGQTVVYSVRSSAPYDLVKDSVLVQPFNVVAVK